MPAIKATGQAQCTAPGLHGSISQNDNH